MVRADGSTPSQHLADMVFCAGCGRPGEACDGCIRPFDPPRFCRRCGRRLAVSVTPAGYRARCRDHGELPPVNGG